MQNNHLTSFDKKVEPIFQYFGISHCELVKNKLKTTECHEHRRNIKSTDRARKT